MIDKTIILLARSQNQLMNFLRISVFIVMAWIGGLKAFPYEAEGIVPFVANSPVMSFFYTKPAGEYAAYKNPEGKVVSKNIEWHLENGTYIFSYALGSFIFVIGILILLGIWFPRAGLTGSLLTVAMALVTLSFLITTPEAFVPDLGGDYVTPHHGFPYLSGVGRLVVKDVIMLGAGLICAAESATRIMSQRTSHKEKQTQTA